jgi:hypothetical protein
VGTSFRCSGDHEVLILFSDDGRREESSVAMDIYISITGQHLCHHRIE